MSNNNNDDRDDLGQSLFRIRIGYILFLVLILILLGYLASK